MDRIKSWAEYGAFHGVSYALVASRSRKFMARRVWLLLFLSSLLICGYFQLKLLLEIIVEKPTVVEVGTNGDFEGK